MKILVVYYSRTENTAQIAQELANTLECDIEEIIDTKNRSGILGWIRSGRDGGSKSLTVINEPVNDPSQYDLIVIGTPVWAGHVSTPVRTYIHQNQANFNNVAFFCTAGSDNVSGTLMDMTELSGTSPVATLTVRAKEIKNRTYTDKIQEFVKSVKM